MAGEQRVLQLRHDRVLVAEHAVEQRLTGGDLGDGVAPDLLLDRHRLPAGGLQIAEGGSTVRHASTVAPGRRESSGRGRCEYARPSGARRVNLDGTWRAPCGRRRAATRCGRARLRRRRLGRRRRCPATGAARRRSPTATGRCSTATASSSTRARPGAASSSRSTASSTKPTCGSTAPTSATRRATSSRTPSTSPACPRLGSEHVLAVEVACAPQRDRTAKRNITGVFQHWDCADPSWNPGGLWRPVRVDTTGAGAHRPAAGAVPRRQRRPRPPAPARPARQRPAQHSALVRTLGRRRRGRRRPSSRWPRGSTRSTGTSTSTTRSCGGRGRWASSR